MSLVDEPSPFAPRKPRRRKNGNGSTNHADWRALLLTNMHGKPRSVVNNAITALQHAPEWSMKLSYNEFVDQPALVAESFRLWTDVDDIRTAAWMQRHGIDVSPSLVRDAVEVVARDHSFHPVRDYLASCRWDGEPRLDGWVSRYLGVEESGYSRAVGARWMISAVARVMKPGEKVDCLLVLEGPQGLMKSTALKTIGDPWFTDELADVGSKDAALQVAGKWIIELAELDSIKRGEVSRIKAYFSRQNDRYRPPYGRNVVERARQCVFAATTNEGEWGRDETGLRRFWPLACRHIDIDGLAAAKDQLWAEARDRYEAGESWWLDTPELIIFAQTEQEARIAPDTWAGFIRDYASLRSSVSVAEILAELGFLRKEQDRASQMRVAGCLKLLGYERFQHYNGGVKTWRYRNPTQPNLPFSQC